MNWSEKLVKKSWFCHSREASLSKGVQVVFCVLCGGWFGVESWANGVGSVTGKQPFIFHPRERTGMRASLTPTLTTPYVCLMADPRSLRALLTICGEVASFGPITSLSAIVAFSISVASKYLQPSFYFSFERFRITSFQMRCYFPSKCPIWENKLDVLYSLLQILCLSFCITSRKIILVIRKKTLLFSSLVGFRYA